MPICKNEASMDVVLENSWTVRPARAGRRHRLAENRGAEKRGTQVAPITSKFIVKMVFDIVLHGDVTCTAAVV